MLTIINKCRRNQKYRYAVDSLGVVHRLIDRFKLGEEIIRFKEFYRNRQWLPLNYVRQVYDFIKKAFSSRSKLLVVHMILNTKDDSLSPEEKSEKIAEAHGRLFDYGIKSSSFRNKNRNAKCSSFLSFNVSDSGNFHCHCFFILPPELFRSAYKLISYFNLRGITCHLAESEQGGQEVLSKKEAFIWLLYLAKFEGQDNFPKGFKTFRRRSGNLKKSFVETREVPSSVSPCVPDVDSEFREVESPESKENASETQEELNIEEILENQKNAELHQNSEGRRRLETSKIYCEERLSRNRRRIRQILEACQPHLFQHFKEKERSDSRITHQTALKC